MYFVRLAFLVRSLEHLLDLSGHINEVNFKKEINTLGSALKGLFNKKTQKYFNGTNQVPYSKIDGGFNVVTCPIVGFNCILGVCVRTEIGTRRRPADHTNILSLNSTAPRYEV